jgi:hypothetical protein
MRRLKQSTRVTISATLFALGTSVPISSGAAEPELFYRGAFDHKIVEAPNGAKVNSTPRARGRPGNTAGRWDIRGWLSPI